MSKNAKTVNNRTREIIEVKSKVCSTKACSVGQRTAALLRDPPGPPLLHVIGCVLS